MSSTRLYIHRETIHHTCFWRDFCLNWTWMFQQCIKCGPFLGIEGKVQPLQKTQKVCTAVGLLAILWYIAVNRKAGTAILKVYFDLASVFEKYNSAINVEISIATAAIFLVAKSVSDSCWRSHLVCVLPNSVKALNVQFVHGVSAPKESIQSILGLKLHGAIISCCLSWEQVGLVTQISDPGKF